MQRNDERQRRLDVEKKEINETIQFYKQLEKDEQRKHFAKEKAFENDLVAQMEYGSKLKEKV